ncbi:type III-B CRISPR-associated protein Cas10/Cmr2 [Clostridium sediminicola]|uniref:type III-B CRISPR-associated protein Cas10/Cmr2 n=1 Tax=Clostridium sediminicola TaxID=3114879 RepID=UPI0031F21096
MSGYIGLTIGPIVDTVGEARSTGELWGASYIFSFIMKNIIKELNKKKKYEFIIPFTEKEAFEIKKIGLFHDRFIMDIKEEKFQDAKQEVDNVIENTIDEIANNIVCVLNNNKKDKNLEDNINGYIKKYFQIHYAYLPKAKDNLINEMNNVLDVLELNYRSLNEVKDGENYLFRYLTNEMIKESILCRNAGLFDKCDNKLFPSILQIAMREITKRHNINIKSNDDLDYLAELKRKMNEKKIEKVKKVYKYIAVVQSDGDSIGEIIKKLSMSNSEKIFTYSEFSKKLFEFAKEANSIVEKYDGFTIYAGGDDLLFLAPVSNDKSNILDLVREISESFNCIFEEYIEELEKKPSVSFGIDISYYKDPLNEKLDNARSMLFSTAKEFEIYNIGNSVEKNAVALKLTKHSGQTFDVVFNKKSESFNIFNELVKISVNNKDLKSIQYKLFEEKKLLIEIINDDSKIDNYFENSIINKYRKESTEEVEEFICKVKDLLINIKKDVGVIESEDKSKEKIMDKLYSCLKFINFLNEEGNIYD